MERAGEQLSAGTFFITELHGVSRSQDLEDGVYSALKKRFENSCAPKVYLRNVRAAECWYFPSGIDVAYMCKGSLGGAESAGASRFLEETSNRGPRKGG